MIEITRLFDFAYYQLETHNLDAALVTKYDGEWVKTSTKKYLDKANAVSRALLKMGVKKNDKIAVISSTNRTEWNIMDIGVLQIGAQNIPIYPTISAEDYEYVLNHSEAIYCFVSDEEVYEKVKKVKSNTKVKEVYSFDHIDGCKHYSELFEHGKDDSNQSEVEARKDAVQPDDLATIIYTSGTTGKPKGVMLSHWNITSNVLDSSPRVPLPPSGETRVLSFLPICHIFERVLIYVYQYAGTSIYFAEALDKIGDNAKEINPHLMSVVPRLLEKVFDKIMLKGEDLTGIKKALFFWAVRLGEQWEPYGANGGWYNFKLKIANKLIFSKWREALGGELTTMVSGSAALQPRLSRVFAAAGMQVMEGYGLTETSPVVSVGLYRDNMYKVGTVGKPIDNVEVKIADDGELLIKGPNVMQGYYKDPEKTASVMTGDFFHTGDKGEIDADGFLKITGRKKEMFKTSGGKYIIPTLLENDLKQSLFIEQVMVIGEGEKMPAALIQPNFEFIRDWIEHKEHNIGTTEEEIASSEKVIKRIQKEVNKYNARFGKWEQIKRFELTSDVWSIDGGHLTPTMKMKRDVIKGIYKDLYEKIYRG
ncbi:AMP-dependent synthetase/ligase [Psychroserpens sp.]|uniref:AMP-dependent synthetase/ligase n=1 Tax=Psychroserpens sp. TaxID=2020870 RepID=UPI001AFFBC45|nr:AMP-dependent synthetase/ligase [Psychroserpens sp.]MBO6607035.1 long-chain fatty acid--CoA ligase [Psychroserpens sp.]MBO6631767.1 long-chain fatty acid--CoA ligase [Psychroserpens sp.]MBO6654181.1 long-chain fatty acid--CoA ligase [Psychroserpens sp.]MBO6682533.1 long-chain fatty acid--CoA ligase [Psychroserpens sp.]MBO6750807.1 long-chain fatty acid--CoA ligase [Psychroserpens sp.]